MFFCLSLKLVPGSGVVRPNRSSRYLAGNRILTEIDGAFKIVLPSFATTNGQIATPSPKGIAVVRECRSCDEAEGNYCSNNSSFHLILLEAIASLTDLRRSRRETGTENSQDDF